MANESPINSSDKQSSHFLSFIDLIRIKLGKYFLLGVAVLLILGFFIYATLTFGSVNSKIRFSPSDVVYGEKLQAIHNMGPANPTPLSISGISDSSEKPEIRLSEVYFDFGEINANQVVTRTFVIANLGQSPLIIFNAYTTCGCTTADFTAAEIPPGKVVLMTLSFDAGFHPVSGSTVRRGVVLYTNDPDHPIQEIWIQASIRGNGE